MYVRMHVCDTLKKHREARHVCIQFCSTILAKLRKKIPPRTLHAEALHCWRHYKGAGTIAQRDVPSVRCARILLSLITVTILS